MPVIKYQEFIPHVTLQDSVKRFWILEKEYGEKDSVEKSCPKGGPVRPAVAAIVLGGHAARPEYLFIRLPLQIFLIAWIWWFALRTA